jgi:hypothetical protein
MEFTEYSAIYIPSTILRREDWHQVADNALSNNYGLNQFYFQLAVLGTFNPKYVIVNSTMFIYAGNEPREYNFEEVFVRSYLKVLEHFVGSGLTEEAIRLEKFRLLQNYFVPWYQRIHRFYDKEIQAGLKEIFTENYSEWDDYQKEIDWIRSLE